MKLSEMNYREKIAAKMAWESCGWVVGGYENSIADYGADSEEGREATVALADHEGLVAEIYDHYLHVAEQMFGMKHLRFVGKAFVLERIERRLKSWGY